MFKWIQLALEQYKTVMAILVLLGVSGVSIYGNVNEINPWNPDVVEQEPPAADPQVTVIEKTIETRVESGVTDKQVKAILNTAMVEHIEEFH